MESNDERGRRQGGRRQEDGIGAVGEVDNWKASSQGDLARDISESKSSFIEGLSLIESLLKSLSCSLSKERCDSYSLKA